jgi:hypothetical protein
VPPPT